MAFSKSTKLTKRLVCHSTVNTLFGDVTQDEDLFGCAAVLPIDVLSLPWPNKRSLLTPNMLGLFFRISAVSTAVLPTSFRVRAFQQLIFFLFFAFNML